MINKDEIEEEFRDFIRHSGFDKSDFYAGVTRDAEYALFKVHKVDRSKENRYMFRDCGDPDKAVDVAKYLIEELGLDGNADADASRAETVYIYKKEYYTTQ